MIELKDFRVRNFLDDVLRKLKSKADASETISEDSNDDQTLSKSNNAKSNA